MRLLLVVGMATACSKAAPPAEPCERGAKLELHAVDSDSDYMKRVFAHVGSSRDGSPTDQAALDAGIRADIDQWQTDIVNANNLPVDTKRVTDYYLVGADRSVLEHYLAGLDAPPADREIRFEHTNMWRTYYVVKAPMLDTSAIADVQIGKNKYSGHPTLNFTFTRDGRQAFAKGTATVVGKKVATIIDGVLMSAPVVNEPITGGRFSVDMPDDARAEAMLAKFRCVK